MGGICLKSALLSFYQFSLELYIKRSSRKDTREKIRRGKSRDWFPWSIIFCASFSIKLAKVIRSHWDISGGIQKEIWDMGPYAGANWNLTLSRGRLCGRAFHPQSTYIYRIQSSVWRLPNFWPPTCLKTHRGISLEEGGKVPLIFFDISFRHGQYLLLWSCWFIFCHSGFRTCENIFESVHGEG